MNNIWQKLKKPIFILAPMEDVTDTVFRRIVMSAGSPDLFFTEFTSVEGMFSKGDKKVNQRLKFTPEEKPLIAQIWGLKPENYFKAGKLLAEMGFDGIDINMGCPEKNVVRKGACSGLINNPSLAKEIIQATKEGAQEAARSLNQETIPVSVKTRIGFKKIQTEEWLGFLLDQNLAALTVHGRTTAEMSAVPAHWDEIGKAGQLRNEKKVDTLIIGNGDVQSMTEAKEKVQKYGLDGIMIGRGIFHNIWLFNENVDPAKKSLEERLDILVKHVDLFEQAWGKTKPFQILKKFFKIYLSGFDGAQDLRMKFMETKNGEEVKELVTSLLIHT
jgi:nifR3 family TIM-barrel protein